MLKRVAIMATVAAALVTSAVTEAKTFQQFRNGVTHNPFWDGRIDVDKMETSLALNPSRNNELEITAFCPNRQPCVSADGALLFVFGTLSEGNQGQLVAVNAIDDGSDEIVWSKTVYDYTLYESISSPVYADGYVYWAGSNAADTAYVYKINAMNGSSEAANGGWMMEIEGKAIVNATPLVVDGKVFISVYPTGFGAYDAVHYALDVDDGSVLWSNTEIGGQGGGAMAYDADTDSVFQTSYVGGKHNLSSLNAETGAVNWTTSFDVVNNFFNNGVTVASGYIYVQDYSFAGGAKLYKINATDGSLAWSADTAASGDGCACVDLGGNVYVCGGYSGTGTTQAFDQNGSLLWTYENAGGWVNSPTVTMAGETAYVLIGDQSSKNLHVLKAIDGSLAKTMSGSGPVAFGKSMFYSTSSSGTLYGTTTGSDYLAKDVITTVTGTFNDTRRGPTVSVINDDGKELRGKTLYSDSSSVTFEFNRLDDFSVNQWYDLKFDEQNVSKVNVLTPAFASVSPMSASAESSVDVVGFFFGTGRVKVELRAEGETRGSKCKCFKSYMFPETGLSKLQFEVPKRAEKGTYDLVFEIDKTEYVIPGFAVK